MKKLAIIGSGPSALLLAAMLDKRKYQPVIYEKNAAPARKFLVAGDGGLNLTHAEALDLFVTRYKPQSFIEPFIRRFTPADLRQWLERLGIPTITGSSNRVFPEKNSKPAQVLKAITDAARSNGTAFRFGHEWTGWEGNRLRFQTKKGTELVDAPDFTVFAMGGASWPVTGTDGSWAKILAAKGIRVHAFESSNAAVLVDWPAAFIAANEGRVLKSLVLHCGDESRQGDIVIKADGMEGGPVYFHSAGIRAQLKQGGTAQLRLDLQPSHGLDFIHAQLRSAGNRSRSEILRRLGLQPVSIALLKTMLPRDTFTDAAQLAASIKAFPLTVRGMGPLEAAISSAGGIDTAELDEHLALKKMPGCFALGEMIDWDAPTGGYLLQACFSMGFSLAQHLNSLPGKATE